MIINDQKQDFAYYKNRVQKYIRHNYKKIIVGIILLIIARQLQKTYLHGERILELSNYLASLGLVGYIALFGIGVVTLNIGLPFLTFEMGMGYIIHDIKIAILLAVVTKITGSLINIFIARKYLRVKVQEHIQRFKIYQALRQLQQQKARKSLFLLSIMEAPMMFKNFFIALFNYKFKDIFSIYIGVSSLQATWYVVLGSEMEDFTNPNSTHQTRSQIICGVMFLFTLCVISYITIITKQLIKEDNQVSSMKKIDDQYQESNFGSGFNQSQNSNTSLSPEFQGISVFNNFKNNSAQNKQQQINNTQNQINNTKTNTNDNINPSQQTNNIQIQQQQFNHNKPFIDHKGINQRQFPIQQQQQQQQLQQQNNTVHKPIQTPSYQQNNFKKQVRTTRKMQKYNNPFQNDENASSQGDQILNQSQKQQLIKSDILDNNGQDKEENYIAQKS